MDPSLLPSLAWFAHIARHRSFTRAAAETGVSRAALSQQLKSLERQLGVRLLHRTTRDMSLTEEGQRLLAAVQPALGGIERGLAELSEARSEPTGLIRVNTSRIAARTLLEPVLAEFLALHPRLKLELVMDDGLANIVAEGADAGIRLGESLAEHVVATPITPPLRMVVVGSPDYLARSGVPQVPADLTGHNCLPFRFTSSRAIDRWVFVDPRDETHTIAFDPQGSVTCNDDESVLRAALQGVGLVQHIDLSVRQYLQSGALVRVLQPWCRSRSRFYLYVPSRQQLPAKVRALRDFLIRQAGQLTRAMAELDALTPR